MVYVIGSKSWLHSKAGGLAKGDITKSSGWLSSYRKISDFPTIVVTTETLHKSPFETESSMRIRES